MAEEELRPQHETLQARDKVVLKMTRDGAAEENLTQGSTERISHRPEDAVFQSEENASASEETPASQKPSQQQLYHSETSKVAAPQSSAPPPPSVSFGSVAAQSVVTQKLRKTQAIQGLDADETLEKAAETAASAPVFEEESSGKMRRLEKKAEKAHQRLDAAREKLPTHKVLKKDRVFDEQTGKAKTRLHFEDELKKPKSQSKLTFEAERLWARLVTVLLLQCMGKSMRLSRITPVWKPPIVRKLSRSPLFVITAIIRKPKPINPMKRCPSWSMKRRLLIRSFKWRRLFRPTPKQRKAI